MADNTPNVSEVSFRRKFNLGDFETMDIELTATIAQGQNPGEVLKALDKATVRYRDERQAR